MSMGDEVGYGAGIAPHPNGEREKTSAIFNIAHNRSPRPSGERVKMSMGGDVEFRAGIAPHPSLHPNLHPIKPHLKP